jgi:hypothetical protein
MVQCPILQHTHRERRHAIPAIFPHNLWERFLARAVFSSFLAISFALAAIASQPQDHSAEYKEKYEKETDPVRKARALGNYGDWQVGEFVRQANANEFDAALITLNAFRNEVRSAFDALKARGVNPERKPDGFKELEIHLDKTLWKLDRAVALVPYASRPAFQDIRDELGRIHTELIRMLFPRVPGGS